jgi:hypothetical protein
LPPLKKVKEAMLISADTKPTLAKNYALESTLFKADF